MKSLLLFLPAVLTLSLNLSCASDPNAGFDIDTLPIKERTEFQNANVILLGEQHDNPIHHDIQRDVLETLGQQGRLKSVIFEQIDWENQGVLSQLNSENLGKLEKKLEWEKSGWPDYDLYEPLIETAVKYRARVVAGGLPKNRVEAIYKYGFEGSFSAAEIERIKIRLPVDDSTKALIQREIYEGHCRMIPEDQTEKMVPIQRARDAALIKGYIKEADQTGTVVFILGNGHARKDFGVPYLLNQIDPTLKIWSAGMQEQGSEPFPPGAFDKVWITEKADREDPCQQMKRHVDSKDLENVPTSTEPSPTPQSEEAAPAGETTATPPPADDATEEEPASEPAETNDVTSPVPDATLDGEIPDAD